MPTKLSKKDILQPLEKFFLQNTTLVFTDKEKKLIREKVWSGDKVKIDFERYQTTAFFDFYTLTKKLQNSLWKYGLHTNEGENKKALQKRVAEKTFIPFAASNADGSRTKDYDIFGDMSNWGCLCVDVKKYEQKESCIFWVYRGEIIPWGDSVLEIARRVQINK